VETRGMRGPSTMSIDTVLEEVEAAEP